MISRAHTRLVAIVAVVGVIGVSVAACSSGKSALDAGNNAGSAAPGSSAPPASGAANSSDSTVQAASTTAAPLAGLPGCPTTALDNAGGPVEITFWHGMANQLEKSLVALTDAYNASQSRVVVKLENQTSYDSTIDKYIQSSQDSRPTIVQLPEYSLQSFAQSDTFVPIQACLEDSKYDTSALLQRTLDAYKFQGIQWSMPFNVSNPVLYYNRKRFVAAGLDPSVTPITLEELRATSQKLVDTGAAKYGLVVDSGPDSGGSWFLEQWFGRAGEPFADNGNGRVAPATKVLYDGKVGVDLMTYMQKMINDGLAVSVGDNPGGQDAFLRMIDPDSPGAMTMGTSAALGSVLAALGSGIAPGLTSADIGVGPMPGPSPEPGVQVGGASLWIVADKGDQQTAAAWDFIKYLVSAQVQSQWASETGYVPVRSDATELDPLKSTYANDPRFKVPFDQLLASVDSPASLSPVLGPQREVRVATANAVAAILGGADVATSLSAAAAKSNALIASYNQRN